VWLHLLRRNRGIGTAEQFKRVGVQTETVVLQDQLKDSVRICSEVLVQFRTCQSQLRRGAELGEFDAQEQARRIVTQAFSSKIARTIEVTRCTLEGHSFLDATKVFSGRTHVGLRTNWAR